MQIKNLKMRLKNIVIIGDRVVNTLEKIIKRPLMLNYLVFGIAIIIFATVIIISGKAISRGIEAKQNKKINLNDENSEP